VSALKFCQKNFSIIPVRSSAKIDDLNLSRQFDLIWCGSLVTHLDEQAVESLLRFFFRHLSKVGVCVFTTHGRLSAEWIRGRTNTYGLTEAAQETILRDYENIGFGYADYPNAKGYGISLINRPQVAEIARRCGGWKEVYFAEHGWDNHQDVFAFSVAP
jgi:hypothetical protein